MTTQDKKSERSHVGYGTTYWKGSGRDLGNGDAIDTVLGGQVWLVKPDKETKAINPCLWMQAGVVKNKDCTNYYDCTTCKYDKGMIKAVAKGKRISWQDAMRKRPAMDRICRHSLTNRIERRVCAYDFLCGSCDFDQYFEEVYSQKVKSFPASTQNVKGFVVPEKYYFHNGHAWARIESGGTIRVGLDDFALKVLGDVEALDLPLMGKELKAGEIGWGLKRKKNAADVLSPVDGVILEVNNKVRQHPAIANEEPYGGGWLFSVKNPDLNGTLKELMTDAASLDWMNAEVGQLESMIEQVSGPLAADGGMLQADVYGNLPDLGWKNLTQTFLKT
ncbi:MAG: glycine cleavage system protein H [Proteobacteria bacterium]|nr:glycine cleavage system protein H [Pseudomonadota bacterium]